MKRWTITIVASALLGLAILGYRSQHMAASQAESLTYTPEGRLQSRTTPNGNTIEYQYDREGRLTKIKKSFLSTVSLQYNPASDLISVRAPSGTTELKRDPFGRIDRIISADGRSIAYGYDPWGRVKSLSASNGYQIKYSRNILGRLTSVDDGYGRTSYTYEHGSVVRQLPNGMRSSFTFSPSGRVVSILHQQADGSLIASFEYAYRPDGKVKTINEKTSNGQKTLSYEYDPLGRLTLARSSNGDRTEYTYDSAGNRQTEVSNGRTKTFTYDANGRLLSSGATTYRYDRSGNLVFKRDGETGKTTRYEYDVDDRLVAVRGTKTVRYTYDGLGNRIGREADGETSVYLNDPSGGLPQPFVVFDKSGRTSTQYLLADSKVGSRDETGRTLYYLGDRMGSTRFVMNEQGQLVRECEYTAFGKLLNAGREAPVGSCGFAGENWDEDTGLLYLRRRYYDPAIGRFISADPFRGDLSNPRSLNRYVYASNDPINRRDPSGLQDDGGGGFTFDAPVIDTGTSFSGSSLSQNFADNWSTPGPPQVQTSDPAGPSFIDAVKSAASTLLAPAQSVLSATSNVASAVSSNSDVAQSAVRTLLSGTDLATALGNVSQTFATGEGLLSPLVAGYDLSQAQGQVAQTNAKIQLGTSIASSALGAAETWGSTAVSGVGLPLAAAGLGEQALETGMLAAGIPQQTIDAAKYNAYTAPFQGINGLNNLIGNLSQSIASGFTSDLAQGVTQSALNDALGTFGAAALSGTDVLPSVTSANAPVGGVRLDKAAELIGTLGDIKGAVFAPKTRRLVLVGDKNVSLPQMRLDDLAVAFRAAYSSEPAEPSMTIDPDPRDPRGPTMNVIFFGGTENTHFGWVMFEADRVMKTYSVGRDNITKAPVQSQIKGYFNLLELGKAANDSAYKPHLWSRFWLVPETIKLRVSSDGTGVLFDETKIKVCTETMRWVGGKLVSANRPVSASGTSSSPCLPTSGEKDASAEYFAKHFSENYDDFAKENMIYGELKRLAQVYAIAKWMKKAGIQIDPLWVDDLEAQPYKTPRTTPSVSNSESRTWRTVSATHTETHSVFGGTDLGAPVTFKARDSRADAFAASVLKGEMASGDPSELSIDGRPQSTATIPTATQPDYGSFRISSSDISVASPAGNRVQLLRSYTSFNTAPTPFGRSWSLLLPRLYFLAAAAKGDSRTVSVSGIPGTAVSLQRFNLTDDFGGLHQEFTEHFVDQEWKRIGFRPKQPSSVFRGLYPNPEKSYSLWFSNGDEWRFDVTGNLVSVRTGTASVMYQYETGTSRLKGISLDGASIQLEYDSQQRIVRARSSVGGDVRYTYDTEGNLFGVESAGRRTTYAYDRNHQLLAKSINGHTVWTNEYDDQGRLLRQLVSGGDVFQQRVDTTKEGGRRIIQRRGGLVTTYIYDSCMRLVEVRRPTDVLTYSYYRSGALKELRDTRSDNARVEVYFTEDHREVKSIDLRGTTHDLTYDERGRLSKYSVNGLTYLTYRRDFVGRPLTIDCGTVRATYVYDQSGRIIRYVVASTESETRPETLSIMYDQAGKIAEITTDLGSISVRRSLGRISLTANGATTQTVFNADGQISEILGSEGGTIKYSRAPDGQFLAISLSVDGQNGGLRFRQGRLEEQTDLGGGRTHYRYTNSGMLSVVIDAYGAVTNYSYGPGGHLTQILLPNGRRIDYSYDSRSHRLQIRAQ